MNTAQKALPTKALPTKALQTKTLPTITRSTQATITYAIRASHGRRASISIQTGVAGSGDAARIWIDMTVLSDTGLGPTDAAHHYWSHAGGADWRDFLAGLDMEYLMGKLLRENLRATDIAASLRHCREVLIDWRREASITKNDLRSAWNDLRDIENEGLDDTEAGGARFIERLYEIEAFSCEAYEYLCTSIKPSAREFYAEIWTPFAQALRAEMAEEKKRGLRFFFTRPGRLRSSPSLLAKMTRASRGWRFGH